MIGRPAAMVRAQAREGGGAVHVRPPGRRVMQARAARRPSRRRQPGVVDVRVVLDDGDRADPATPARTASNRAASAAGSWNGTGPRRPAPTPRPGDDQHGRGRSPPRAWRRSAGPALRSPRPVVRISVTVGLWTKNCRSANCSGTVASGPKFTMSSAPRLTTCGTPAAPAAVSRSGPALSTPPTSSSASSVVVRSSTPASMPERASASSARPPEPVAWKTSTS